MGAASRFRGAGGPAPNCDTPACAGGSVLARRHPGKERPTKATECPGASFSHPLRRLHHHHLARRSPPRPLPLPLPRLCLWSPSSHSLAEAACGICPLISPSFLNPGCTGFTHSPPPPTAARLSPPSPSPHIHTVRTRAASRYLATDPAVCVLTLPRRRSNRVSTLCPESACFVSLPLCSNP